MPTNRYYQPAGYQHLDQPYVPYPTDFLAGVGDKLEKRSKEADEQLYKLQDLAANVNAIPQHEPFKQKLLQDTYSQLEDISNDISNNNIPQAQRKLRKAYFGFQTNKDRGVMENSYNIYNKQYLPNREAYQKEGKFDPIYWNQLDNFKGARETGEINPFNYSGVPAKEDYVENAQSLAAGIASDKKAWEGYKTNSDGTPMVNSLGQLIKTNGSTEELSLDKIRSVAKANVRGLLEGKGGQYFMDKLAGQSINYRDLNDNQRSLINQNAEDLLTKLALKQITSKTSSGTDLQNLTENQLDMQGGTGRESLNLNSARIPQADKMKINVQREGSQVRIPYTDQEAEAITKGLAGAPVAGASTAALSRGKPVREEEAKLNFTPEQKATIERAKREFGVAPGNDVQEAELLNKYIDYHNSKLTNPGLTLYNVENPKDMKVAQNEQKYFFDAKGQKTYLNRNFKLVSGDGEEKLTGSDFSKEYGNDEKYTKTIAGTISPDNAYYPSGKVVNVIDNKTGKQVATYAMSGTHQSDNDPVNRTLHEMYQAKYNPTGENKVSLPHGDGTIDTYTVKYEDLSNQLNNEGLPEVVGHKAILVDKNGKTIAEAEVSAGEDVVRELFNKLPR